MFPIHFKLTIGSIAQLQRLTAFLEQDTDQALAASPRLPVIDQGEQPATKQAPGKPNAATTARSQPTAEAAQSVNAQSADAPATQTTATEQAADASSAAPKVTYPDLAKAVLTLHKMDPKAAQPIAKSLGADTFKLLPEAKWGEALRLVNEAIAAQPGV